MAAMPDEFETKRLILLEMYRIMQAQVLLTQWTSADLGAYMRTAAALFISLLSTMGLAQNHPLYYGSESSEAIIQFQHSVYVMGSQVLSEEGAKTAAEEQATYLFGAFSNHRLKGAPKNNGLIHVLGVERQGSYSKVNYIYQGTSVLSNRIGSTYSFYLPRNPMKAYERGLVINPGGYRFFPCTDANHPGFEYFWYFWNPKAVGCPLVENVDYEMVTAAVERKTNTALTFPHYEDLIHNGILRVDLLMGMDNSWESKYPFDSKDLSASIYKEIYRNLVRMGYKSQKWSLADMRKVSPSARENSFYVESLVKKTDRGMIEVRFFFGATSFHEGTHFHHFLKAALEDSSVMIYAGHSGLGEYLDLPKIEAHQNFQVSFDPSLEQIYFFNGCSSYPYYNSMYMDRKGGSQHLDIMTNGLATLFSAIEPSTMAIIKALDRYMLSGQKSSYQEIVREADSYNLLGINGDED